MRQTCSGVRQLGQVSLRGIGSITPSAAPHFQHCRLMA
jgi:hypothetical protein